MIRSHIVPEDFTTILRILFITAQRRSMGKFVAELEVGPVAFGGDYHPLSCQGSLRYK